VTSALVTVVCATYNARPAVRLTFASFFRHNPGIWPVYVADNGSTDGTLDELRSWPGIQVVTLPQRIGLIQSERALDQHGLDVLDRRYPEHGLRFAAASGQGVLDQEGIAEHVAEHGVTLDWLVARAGTPFVLTLDSDVEFLADGCLEAMLEYAQSRGLDALGVYEQGYQGYGARLAPYVLLLRTAVFRQLGLSFRAGSITGDRDEARRWLARPPAYQLDPAELGRYPTTRVYATAAYMFEKLVSAGRPWADLPSDIASRFHHYGHVSWGGLPDSEGGSASSRQERALRLAEIERALQAYGG
jgi:hypothetical protein